ncbi:potassium transporter KefC [Novimethylophilus kurashikiensis]|uniref:Potassium transporter KefC n=1 Tax=Novimethylophilus kurashikiensis TaxID=1825523 RepID=A0A2R5F718_9PROT|nr:monovalent cation:proton antiporter-2 (CPA2) family protein [Novimethylophilus kurashikiensis]GBG13629.1 potassium transporter KefC [Novimethylophilus kurashikiensis]
MASSDFLSQAAIYLTAAVVAVPLFKRLGLGSVLGYLLAGILIGPHALQLISDPEQVLHFAEFGVVMLLFLVGLELEPQKAWALRRALFGLGGMQVAMTILVVAAGAKLIGLSWPIAVVVGIGVAMSSTAIGLASLEERRQLATPGGQASFAVLLFQDLSVIPLFMVLALMAPDAAKSGVDGWAVAKAVLVIAAIVVASRTVLRPVMRIVAQTGLREIFVAFSLLLVIGVSLAVQAVGLSMALGTFLAGVLLADSEYHYELRLDIEPVKGLLLGLFFIAVGMSVDLSLLTRQPETIVGLALLLVSAKILLLLALGRGFKLPFRDALLFGVALSQIGEFAFVIFGVALAQGTLPHAQYDLMNAVVAVSMLMTPLLLILYDRVVKLECKERPQDGIEEANPVIIAGFGRFGQIVGRVLIGNGIAATLIDKDPNQVDLMRSFGWRCYYGDASRLDLLEEAGIAQARLLVIAVDDPESAMSIAKLAKQRWPHVPVVARARSRTDAFDLRELGLEPVRETFYSSLEAARQSLLALGETAESAATIIAHFERHDLEQFEKTRHVRHDMAAMLNIAEQGRQDLKDLLAAERGERPAQQNAA